MATEEALLSFLPLALYQGKIVVEVGERATAALAEKAAKLILVPHLDSPHDLTESEDLVFSSSSVFVDLSDKQVAELAKKLLKWVKLGGYIFFTELCSRQFREPRFYTKVFRECRHISDVSGKSYQFSLVASKCVAASKDENQICWIWQKLNSDSDEEFQQFLDNVQYKSNDILRYEKIFGPGMCCIGGLDSNTEFVSMLDLKAGQKVLDVGCGIGGAAFYMSENFDVNVVGIDYSENMISFALERALGLKCLVEFEVVDCTKKSYPDNTFDVIYSRDSISLIQDKPALFRNFYKWLKPCGKVLVSDYCRKAGTLSQHTQEYIKKRRYDLHDIDTYGQMLKDAGFEEVKTEDRTKQFTAILTKELKRLENEKEEFIGDLSEEEYIDFVDGWKSKLSRTVSGEQTWGLFFAKKK